MRDYEVVYIFKSTLTTEEIESRLESYNQRILGSEGSEITAVEHWGKRQLAYPIDRNDNGYYVVTQFTASPSVLPEFERALKLDDDLLRHLVVLSEGELASPVSMDMAGGEGASDDKDEYRTESRKPAVETDGARELDASDEVAEEAVEDDDAGDEADEEGED